MPVPSNKQEVLEAINDGHDFELALRAALTSIEDFEEKSPMLADWMANLIKTFDCLGIERGIFKQPDIIDAFKERLPEAPNHRTVWNAVKRYDERYAEKASNDIFYSSPGSPADDLQPVHSHVHDQVERPSRQHTILPLTMRYSARRSTTDIARSVHGDRRAVAMTKLRRIRAPPIMNFKDKFTKAVVRSTVSPEVDYEDWEGIKHGASHPEDEVEKGKLQAPRVNQGNGVPTKQVIKENRSKQYQRNGQGALKETVVWEEVNVPKSTGAAGGRHFQNESSDPSNARRPQRTAALHRAESEKADVADEEYSDNKDEDGDYVEFGSSSSTARKSRRCPPRRAKKPVPPEHERDYYPKPCSKCRATNAPCFLPVIRRPARRSCWFCEDSRTKCEYTTNTLMEPVKTQKQIAFKTNPRFSEGTGREATTASGASDFEGEDDVNQVLQASWRLHDEVSHLTSKVVMLNDGYEAREQRLAELVRFWAEREDHLVERLTSVITRAVNSALIMYGASVHENQQRDENGETPSLGGKGQPDPLFPPATSVHPELTNKKAEPRLATSPSPRMQLCRTDYYLDSQTARKKPENEDQGDDLLEEQRKKLGLEGEQSVHGYENPEGDPTKSDARCQAEAVTPAGEGRESGFVSPADNPEMHSNSQASLSGHRQASVPMSDLTSLDEGEKLEEECTKLLPRSSRITRSSTKRRLACDEVDHSSASKKSKSNPAGGRSRVANGKYRS